MGERRIKGGRSGTSPRCVMYTTLPLEFLAALTGTTASAASQHLSTIHRSVDCTLRLLDQD